MLLVLNKGFLLLQVTTTDSDITRFATDFSAVEIEFLEKLVNCTLFTH